MNFNLNPGGIIGASLAGAGILLYFLYTAFAFNGGPARPGTGNTDASAGYASTAILLAVFAAVIMGQLIWTRFFAKSNQS
jgi:hypothetical protein